MRLPSTTSLEAVEAVARLGSFAAAGVELGLSVPALSRRVASLETRLGVRLFDRHARGVALTSAGAAYADRVASALLLLRNAGDSLGRPRRDVARVTTIPGFATRWLLPRLPAFSEANPGVEIDIRTSLAFENLETRDIDIAIRLAPESSGIGDLLLPVHVLPVWSAERFGALDDPASVLRCALLGPDHRPEFWSEWLEAHGMANSTPRIREVDALLLYELAITGAGVAIGIEPLVDGLVARGALVSMGCHRIRSSRSFFVLTRQGRLSHAARLLRAWLLREASSSARPR